jgi:hypothetical protein
VYLPACLPATGSHHVVDDFYINFGIESSYTFSRRDERRADIRFEHYYDDNDESLGGGATFQHPLTVPFVLSLLRNKIKFHASSSVEEWKGLSFLFNAEPMYLHVQLLNLL